MRRLLAALLASSAALGAPGALAAGPEKPILFDKIVAVVDDEVILRSEVVAQARPFVARLPDDPKRAEHAAKVRRELLERMIDDILVAREAARLGVKVEESEVDRAIEFIAKQNGVTRDALVGEITKQGLTMPLYLAEIRRQLVDAKWVAITLRPRIAVPPPNATPEQQKVYALALEQERKKAIEGLRIVRFIEVRW